MKRRVEKFLDWEIESFMVKPVSGGNDAPAVEGTFA